MELAGLERRPPGCDLRAGRYHAVLARRIVSCVRDRPTIKDVAEGSVVSIATVSRALNDKSDVSRGRSGTARIGPPGHS